MQGRVCAYFHRQSKPPRKVQSRKQTPNDTSFHINSPRCFPVQKNPRHSPLQRRSTTPPSNISADGWKVRQERKQIRLACFPMHTYLYRRPIGRMSFHRPAGLPSDFQFVACLAVRPPPPYQSRRKTEGGGSGNMGGLGLRGVQSRGRRFLPGAYSDRSLKGGVCHVSRLYRPRYTAAGEK